MRRSAGALIDDVALAAAVKRGGPIWLGHSGLARSVRPYPGVSDIWRMVARSAYVQLRRSVALLVLCVAGMALVWLVPVAACFAGPAPARVMGAVAWAGMAWSYLPTLRRFGLSAAWARGAAAGGGVLHGGDGGVGGEPSFRARRGVEGAGVCLSRMPDLGRRLSPIYMDVADRPPLTRPRGRGKRIAFGWYGGKFNHLAWLLPLLPEAQHYCEPFAGSAALLLNRAPSPVETYNDTDGAVVNFFRVLRDDWPELQRLIALTPFSREEFHLAITDGGGTALERARRFYVRARQARTGLAQSATLGRWANCKNTSRSGMSGVVSRWLGGVDGLSDIAERLMRVQIENRPALDVIRTL